jgi:hypothetical protein
LFGRRKKDERCRSALIEIDEADLSELGRKARRESLYEIRELQRRERLKARSDREPGHGRGA